MLNPTCCKIVPRDRTAFETYSTNLLYTPQLHKLFVGSSRALLHTSFVAFSFCPMLINTILSRQSAVGHFSLLLCHLTLNRAHLLTGFGCVRDVRPGNVCAILVVNFTSSLHHLLPFLFLLSFLSLRFPFLSLFPSHSPSVPQLQHFP